MEKMFVKYDGRSYEVQSLAEASKLVRELIERYNLGSRDYVPAKLFKNREQFAYVSYNGAVWPGHSYDVNAKALYV